MARRTAPVVGRPNLLSRSFHRSEQIHDGCDGSHTACADGFDYPVSKTIPDDQQEHEINHGASIKLEEDSDSSYDQPTGSEIDSPAAIKKRRKARNPPTQKTKAPSRKRTKISFPTPAEIVEEINRKFPEDENDESVQAFRTKSSALVSRMVSWAKDGTLEEH